MPALAIPPGPPSAKVRANLAYLVPICLVATLGGLLFGYDTGIISGAIEFRDHHRYTARDVRRVAAEAKAAGSMNVLTTEKDAVRLAVCDLGEMLIASVPLVVGVEPADAFQSWLLNRIRDSEPAMHTPQSR